MNNRLVFVNYHYIRPPDDHPYPSIFGKSREDFKSQLLELKKTVNFVGQAEVVEHLRGTRALPDNSLCITFDDGLREQFTEALPVLRSLGIPAIFFVCTQPLLEEKVLNVHKMHLVRSQVSPRELTAGIGEFLGQMADAEFWKTAAAAGPAHYRYDDEDAAVFKYAFNFLMPVTERARFVDSFFDRVFPGREGQISTSLYFGEEEVKELGRLGYLGSHGYDHQPVGPQSANERKRIYAQSKEYLENVSGQEITAFSYPYGSYEACGEHRGELENFGYTFGLSMERAANDLGTCVPARMARFDNNDMPLGKSYRYSTNDFMHQLPLAEWYTTAR